MGCQYTSERPVRYDLCMTKSCECGCGCCQKIAEVERKRDELSKGVHYLATQLDELVAKQTEQRKWVEGLFNAPEKCPCCDSQAATDYKEIEARDRHNHLVERMDDAYKLLELQREAIDQNTALIDQHAQLIERLRNDLLLAQKRGVAGSWWRW